MSTHISNIHIKSFRGIGNLSLTDLKKINILTGDNNSGKTSILELLTSFSNPSSFRDWSNLFRLSSSRIRGPISYYEGFYELFDINSQNKKIEYTIKLNKNNFNVILSATELEKEISTKEYFRIIGLSSFDINEDENLLDSPIIVPCLNLKVEVNSSIKSQTNIFYGQRTILQRQRIINSSPIFEDQNKPSKIYISPTRHAEGDVFLSKVLDNPDLYQEMLTVLKEYDENIISINFDRQSDNYPSSRGTYKILSKNHQKALSLNVYGDGMKKAILLMSAVVAAQDGILLLDECETAIHTSAMSKTFEWILKTCIKLNVQLFLTSHSEEAINKILNCSPDLTNEIALYTLYKDEEGNSVRRLSGKEAIEVHENMGLELR